MVEQSQIDELKQKMTEQRDGLLALLERYDEEEAVKPTSGEGEWSAKQQMSHLCEMETNYRAWVAKALQENGADLTGVYGEPPLVSLEEANSHSVGEHVGEMKRQRAMTMAFIDSMKPEDFERTASQKAFGLLTVMQWLRSYYRHDRMHLDQLRGIDPEYKPRYAGGNEPDQRRG
ncbi:MAG: DinB family protein [Chloroflexota bacterium]